MFKVGGKKTNLQPVAEEKNGSADPGSTPGAATGADGASNEGFEGDNGSYGPNSLAESSLSYEQTSPREKHSVDGSMR